MSSYVLSMGNEYFDIVNALRSKWAIDHKWLSTYILPMGACNGQQVLVQSSYLSQVSQIIFVEKKLSCGEIL